MLFVITENFYVCQIGISGNYFKIYSSSPVLKLNKTNFEGRKVLEQEAGTLRFRSTFAH